MTVATTSIVSGDTSSAPVGKISPRTLDQHDAAAYLGVVSPKTLENWRGLGIGPRYVKLGGRVAYRIADLDTWLEQQIVA